MFITNAKNAFRRINVTLVHALCCLLVLCECILMPLLTCDYAALFAVFAG